MALNLQCKCFVCVVLRFLNNYFWIDLIFMKHQYSSCIVSPHIQYFHRNGTGSILFFVGSGSKGNFFRQNGAGRFVRTLLCRRVVAIRGGIRTIFANKNFFFDSRQRPLIKMLKYRIFSEPIFFFDFSWKFEKSKEYSFSCACWKSPISFSIKF